MFLTIGNTPQTGTADAAGAMPRVAGSARSGDSTAPTPVAGSQQPAAVDPAQLAQAVQDARDAVQQHASNLEFVLDHDTGKTVVKVVDSQTNQVIRQIPSEEMLAISRNLTRIEGLLLEHKA